MFTEALESPLVPALMKEAVAKIAAPAIRNAGTFGGNLGNGSAKADSVLIEFVSDAKLRLVSVRGERVVDVDAFYLGRKKLDLMEDELIAEILLPKDKCEKPYYYKKVGGRNALAISRIALAGVYEVKNGVVADFSAAVIGGAAKFQRFKEIEEAIIGKPVDQIRANPDEYVKMYAEKLVFTRGRVSAEYRRTVSTNLIKDYLATLE